MATAYQINVPASDTGLLGVKQSESSASKVSELLQKDLEAHHVFFNASGFHNHIPHHLLALYGLGSGPEFLQKAYKGNSNYQIKAQTPRGNVVDELRKDYAAAAPSYLGKGKHYADFLRYFQAELDQKGWQAVLTEHLFGSDETSRDLFARLYSGFLHPLIQLMYGIEWQQPAIIAEGLAQAAVHENPLGAVFDKVDATAREAARQRGSATAAPGWTIAELIEGVRNNQKLAKSARWEDPNRIYDGVLVRAPDEAVQYVSQATVTPETVEERTAEMVHTAAWLAAAAAFRPPHIPKMDFFLIHHLNSTPFFLTTNKLSWVPVETKVRLLEYKIRMDVLQYVGRGCPSLDTEAIRTYKPKDQTLVSRPEDLLPRFYNIDDDGHTIKVVRGLLLAQQVSREYAGQPWIRIVDDDMWLKMHYLLLDSVEGQDALWVRSAGFPEAWKDIPMAE